MKNNCLLVITLSFISIIAHSQPVDVRIEMNQNYLKLLKKSHV